MNETTAQILILGGGVAGMSTALALENQDVDIHLVEKSDRLGGNAGNWACMATTSCQNCGACLIQEMADRLQSQANATIHTGTSLAKLSSGSAPVTATLSNGQRLTPYRIVMATGFSPFDPSGIPSYHAAEYDRVITTAQLNTLLREETLSAMTGPAPRIAFLQCVGSRDRKEGRDYCSQVCCKISLRHAKKLLHLMPEARLSLFYMDLQIIGKEARTGAAELAANMELVQGVPAEILEKGENGLLTMVVEDPATRSRVAREFDLIVLSVGMVPSSDNSQIRELLGITPNVWGFFNTPEAVLKEEIIVTGCANGPKDILGSRQEGRIAAAKILEALDKETSAGELPGVAVIGGGDAALAAASAAAELGYPAYSFISPSDNLTGLPRGVEDWRSAKLMSIDGYTGNFTIFLEKEGRKEELTCGAVIAAPLPDILDRTAQFPGAVTLSTFAQTAPESRPEKILFLLDYFGPENKKFSRQTLEEALACKAAGKTVYILMNKMLVHGPTGQQMYDRARKDGIRFLRFDGPDNLEIQSTDNGFFVSFDEATLPGRKLSLTVDCLVVPQTLGPARGFKQTADLLRVGRDREGFFQSANVRHRLVQSPRRGIFFAGPGHDETDNQDLAAEIQAIMADLALQRRACHSGSGDRAPAPVAVNEKKCAKCLTCYRVCPHGAIILNEKSRPQIMPEACFSCQACVSNCPAYAIEADGFDNTAIAARAQKGHTMILACQRSGALAAKELPEATDLVAIPCACRISPDILMKALISGADRVIVSGCHEGNCQSVQGSSTARQQVEKVAAFPGMPREKLVFQAAAANEPHAFARMITKAND